MLTSCEFVSYHNWLCKDDFGEFTVEGHTSYGSLKFEHNFNIATVKLHDQKVNHFPRGFGSFFPHLKSLTISHCGLESISRDDLIGLEDLELLHITSTLLTSLPSDLFIGMTKLKHISFDNNKLKTLSSQLLKPILKNDPTFIAFRGNPKIDAVFDSNYIFGRSGLSLKKFMELIDTKCDKPADEKGQVSTIDSFKDDFAAGLVDLWATGDFSDFMIVANDLKEFRVHKTVLAMQSPVFATMFKSNMEEQQTGKMSITDFSAEAIEKFFTALYTGKIKDMTNAMEVFALAAKYDVPKLKMASEQNVLENINPSNAFDILTLGHLHSSSVLQHKALNVIKKSRPDIELDDGLIDDSQRIKILIDAEEMRKRKMQEVDDEFTSMCKRSKLNA